MYQLRKPLKLGSGSQIPATQSASSVNASTIGAAAGILSSAVDLFPEEQTPAGVSYTGVGKSVAKGALSGAATGASLGSLVPGIGTAIGAGVGALAGGVVSAIGASKAKKQALAQQAAIQRQEGEKMNALSAAFYSKIPGFSYTAYGKEGMQIPGQEGKSGEETAVILSGQRHSEKGPLGNGNPGVDQQGQKIVEVEKNELLLTTEQTKTIESLIDSYTASTSDDILYQLGSQMKEYLLTSKRK